MSQRAGEVLLVGCSGMLGRAWGSLLEQQAIAHTPLTRGELDITEPAQVAARVAPGARWVINCAAYCDVDGAEDQEAIATQINGHAVQLLAQRCFEVGATLVHYSTDYVFDGSAQRPYPLAAPQAPANAYGRGKALGERLLWQSGAEHLLLRTSWLYAPWGKNFVLTMRRLGAERPLLKVVDDQRGSPTSAQELAAASLRLLRSGVRGTFHVCDGGECTWYELARHVVELTGGAAELRPCGSEEYPRKAPRPSYSVLDRSRAESVLGVAVPWQKAVAEVLRAVC